MTTVRRVLALTAVTVALTAAVGISGERGGRTARPLLVPGLRFDDVVGLELTIGDRPPVVVALDGGPVRITAPVAAAADERAVRDLISTIATARLDHVASAGAWHRAGLDTPAAIVRLSRRAGGTLEVRVGAALAASDQTWLAVDGRPGLAPSWVADALVRDPDSLRRRRPFPSPAVVTAVELHGPGLDLVLADQPLRRRDTGASVAVDPARRDRLLERLAALTIEVAIDAPRTDAGVSVRVLGGGGAPAELRGAGPCPGHDDLRVVETSVGVGCVAAVALAEVTALAAELTSPAAIATAPIDRFDRTTVATLELGGTPPVRLEPDGGGWRLMLGDRLVTADDALVRAAATALTTPATVVPATEAGPAAAAPLERWHLHRRSGAVETWEVRRGPGAVTIRRDGEPVVLVLDAAAAAAVRAIGPGLRDRALLAIEPTALAAIEARGAAPATIERGALIDEWRVVARPAVVASASMPALRDRLAALRAEAWLAPDALGAVRRTLRVVVDGGPGQLAPRTIVIELGARRGSGCAVRVDGADVAQLAAADCAALAAPLVTPAPK